jgi:hypothetical protein
VKRKDGGRWRWSVVVREDGGRSGMATWRCGRGREHDGGVVALEHVCGVANTTVV